MNKKLTCRSRDHQREYPKMASHILSLHQREHGNQKIITHTLAAALFNFPSSNRGRPVKPLKWTLAKDRGDGARHTKL